LLEKLKSHAKQLIIHVPNIKHLLMTHEEVKGEEDLKNGKFADLIGRLQGELADARQENERLMRELMNEKEHQRNSEMIK
jgi:two-component sensor histidine kinase